MTIVVAVATPEGLVLGADSRSTYEMEGRHRIASDFTQKVFTVGNMGVATFGIAFIGADTIAGVMDQFAAQQDVESMNVHDFAAALGKFFSDRLNSQLAKEGKEIDVEADGWPLGFLVAGYDDQGVGHIKEINIPNGNPDETVAVETTGGGAMWRGWTDVIGRLIKGIDLLRIEALDLELTEGLLREIRRLEYRPMIPTTIQDGIDYAAFLVRTTIDMQRFSDGTALDPGAIPNCGGPLQLLAIERSGPKWVANLTLTAPSYSGHGEGSVA
jgi:hypothetical protein